MSRNWKAALAPFLAGIPLRTGFAGEVRFGLLNDVRFGERKLPRMIDQMGALALPKGAQPAGRMAAARTEGAGATRCERGARSAGSQPMAGRSSRCRPARSAPARPGRSATTPNWRARSPRTAHRSGSGRPERDAARETNRRRRRQPRARSHRQRSAQRHPGARRRRRRGHQRFRPDACLRRDRHADGRDLRPDQPLALEAAQSDRRHPRAARRRGGARSARAARATTRSRHRRTADVAVETVLAAVREVLRGKAANARLAAALTIWPLASLTRGPFRAIKPAIDQGS